MTKAAKFPSRQAPVLEPEVQVKRGQRRYTTGSNIQLSVKADQKTVDAFNTIALQQGWVMGYTLQRAMEALQRELQNPA